jgi:hypothetical protein
MAFTVFIRANYAQGISALPTHPGKKRKDAKAQRRKVFLKLGNPG